ncbi:MAG: glycosyltransferase [Hyphomicrobiales bacterium]|nr:glycosyltransferase [Hyphomicrobiales bacterium]
MLSVIIATRDDERTLLPTLAALVAGATAGIIREVIVADGGSRDETTTIADSAGCEIIQSQESRGARLKAAADAARAGWLMFLPPGTVLEPRWIEESRQFMSATELSARLDRQAAMFRPAASYRPALIEALVLMRLAFAGSHAAGRGLLIAKSLYASLGGHRAIETPEPDLARRLGRRRVVLLRTGAAMAASAALSAVVPAQASTQ